MIAILLATGQNPAFHGLDESLPIPLLPLADRPFLQHAVEFLVRSGIRRFEFVLSHLPEKVEACFGDGARWGCSFQYHLVPSSGEAFRLARTIASGTRDDILLASGTCLPAFEMSALQPGAMLFREGAWTGWGLFGAGAALLSSMEPGMTAGRLPEGARQFAVERCLSIESGAELLRSQRESLDGSFPGLLIAGRQAEPGVWISRNVVLHPSATVQPPVYIGENCRIGRGAQIGPSAVIGANCIVDSHSSVVNSMVAPGTYVGEALELDSVIVDRNRLVNVRIGASFLVSETFLLGNLTMRAQGRALERWRDRLLALLLLLLLWPVLLVAWLFLSLARGEKPAFRDVVGIPADSDPANWRTLKLLHIPTASTPGRAGKFVREFLPGLISVLAGSVFLVGVRPRTRGEIEAMPADWRSLYLNTKAGLITEADVIFGPTATGDEVYTGEAFYSATESAWHDLRLAGLWLWKLLAGPGKTTTGLAGDAETL
ncbi:MAG: NDP-sugar synthase [Acidobacteriota bacterium]